MSIRGGKSSSPRVSEANMGLSSVKKNDPRLDRRLKRRSVANQSCKNNSSTKVIKRESRAMKAMLLDEGYSIEKTPQAASLKDDLLDEDYKMYLNKLRKSRFNPSVRDDDLDPQYKMFWENVREDGHYFVLEISVDEGIHVLLKYEEDDRLGDDGRPGSPNNLRTVKKRENIEIPKIPKDFPASERKTLIDNKLRPDLSSGASLRGLSSSEPKRKHEQKPEPCDTGIDESYKIFLECIKEEDCCLVFVNKHGKRVKYEEESESESEMLAAKSDPCIDEEKETPFIRSKQFHSSVCILITLHFVVSYL